MPRAKSPQFSTLQTIKSDLKKLGADLELVQDFVLLQKKVTLSQLAEKEPGSVATLVSHIRDNIKNFQSN